MGKLTGKTVLITGASSGIGKAFALRCAEDKARLILSARNPQKLAPVSDEARRLGAEVIEIIADVSDTEQIKQLFLKAIEGGKPIDLVFNNAGLGYIGRIFELKAEEVKKVVDVNITGMLLVTKYAAEVMTRQKSGHIIMTSSMAGLITLPQWSVYVASKWAVTAFADSIRPELAPFNVKVTTLHPGVVEGTEFFDKDKSNIDVAEVGNATNVTEVANAVYSAAFTGKERILIPAIVRSMGLLYRYLPGLAKAMMAKMTAKAQYHSTIEEDEPEFDKIGKM